MEINVGNKVADEAEIKFRTITKTKDQAQTQQVGECSGKNCIGRYTVIKLLGGGGEGNVYLARDEELQRMVAIKRMRTDTEKQRIGEGQREEGKILREADLLRQFRHPMLPVLYDLVWDDVWYLVMEYIQGITLREYIDRNGYVQEEQACRWTYQLLDILGYLHTRKPPVIYRDLKPDNIMVCPDGHLRLIDFGAAEQRDFGTRERGIMAATSGFSAPEQFGKMRDSEISGQPGRTAQAYMKQRIYADERSDIYAVGMVLYYMVTAADPGKPPYARLSIRDYQPLLSDRLERIIRKCTKEEPTGRYQVVEEVRRDLDRCGGRMRHLRRRSFIRGIEKRVWLTEK